MNRLKISLIKLIILLVILSTFLPFLLNFIFGYIIPLLPGVMYVGTNETWVDFIGSFLGASLTLIGVYWQLERNKTYQNKELITNTKAVYTLLEIELINLEKLMGNIIEIYKKMESNKSKNFKGLPLEDMKNFFISKKIKELLTSISPIQTDIIYSFIGKSTPSQKVNLIKITQDYLVIINKFKN